MMLQLLKAWMQKGGGLEKKRVFGLCQESSSFQEGRQSLVKSEKVQGEGEGYFRSVRKKGYLVKSWN